MSKIAIVTWTKWNNYGTILQSYALYRLLESWGHDVVVLDDKYITSTKCVEVYGQETWWRYLKGDIKKALEHKTEFEKFSNKREKRCIKEKRGLIKYHKNNVRYDSLHKLEDSFDVFICGSDQIWTPNNTYFDPYYFLGFVKNKKKISYSPSIGVSEYPTEKKEIIRSLLESFSSISVREETGKKIIGDICNKEISVCLDPTLLIDQNNWHKELKIKNIDKEYALCYFLGEQEWYRKDTETFCKNKNIELVTIPMFKQDMVFGDRIENVGIRGFIELIANAKYIFTDSFHGMLFSIIFKKNVFVFSRFKSTDKLSQNSRIEDFVKKVGLSSRYIKEERIILDMVEEINYNKIYKHIDEYKKESLEYLKSSLTKN